ncbi:MAG: serine hydrolase domain-containing protein [Candidatus Dormibacteria bacterium]
MTTAAPKLTALHDDLVAKVEELAKQHNVPGVAVGILSDGEEDYVFHGVTSIENPLEVDAETLFQIGSTSKTYTATVLAILADRGLVDLSAPVRRYIPGLELQDEDVAARVTVLNLLNHTAGWVGDIHEDTGDGDDALAIYATKLAEVDQQSPLNTIAAYNNASLNLAGHLIENVTGKTFEAAVKELLLDPVGMTDSYYFLADIITRRFTVGHREVDEKLSVTRPYAIPRSVHPAGGIIATIGDQLKYARFHLGDGTGRDGVRVISEAALKRMQETTFPFKAGAIADEVGTSWLIRDVTGVRLVGHGGATNGQMAAFQMVPEKGLAIASLTNADQGALLNRDLVKWLLEKRIGLVQKDDEPIDLPAEKLAVFAGKFDGGVAILDITVEDDHLVLQSTYTEKGLQQARVLLGQDPPAQPPTKAKAAPGDSLIVVEGPAKGMKVAVVRNDNGEVDAINFGGRLVRRVR